MFMVLSLALISWVQEVDEFDFIKLVKILFNKELRHPTEWETYL